MVFNGILKLMPSLSRTINNQQSTINRKSKGFTLIELLVVIALFGLTSTLITVSYLTFERNQRVKKAAQALKSDLRFAQNKALAGDKGVANSGNDCTDLAQCCPATSTLIGWYVTFDTNQSSTYSYAGVCEAAGGAETSFGAKAVTFPSGVTLDSMEMNGGSQSGVRRVLFRPLYTNISLHNDSSAPPQFVANDGSGDLINEIALTGDITIELEGAQSSADYVITIRSTGEVSVTKL